MTVIEPQPTDRQRLCGHHRFGDRLSLRRLCRVFAAGVAEGYFAKRPTTGALPVNKRYPRAPTPPPVAVLRNQ
jgi:hypothetical protein